MAQSTEFDDELELTDYLRILRRRWPWVLLPFVLVIGLATAFTVSQAPSYCSTAQVLIGPSTAEEILDGSDNVFVANRDLANEINFAYSDAVEGNVEAELGLVPNVNITGATDSDALFFRGCGSTAADAALYANTWANVYVDTTREQAGSTVGSAVESFEANLAELRLQRQEVRAPLDALEDRLVAATDATRPRLQTEFNRLQNDLALELQLIDAQVQATAADITRLELRSELARSGTLRVNQVAAEPLRPSNAPLSRNLVLAGVVGLILGAACALIVENLDRSIKTADDIAGVPVLGAIPRPGRDLAGIDLSLATMNYTGSSVAEGYQKVRTALEFALLGRKITSLLITSPDQSEGKTTTSANLAWAMSAVDHRVVLADVDFRRPRIHDVFGCPPEPGLSDNLLHGTPLNKLALRVDDDRSNMVIIPTGAQPPSPGDFVASPAFSGLLRNLEAEADLVILDSPPVLPVSDALSVARQVDGVIVAARAGKTSRQQLAKSVESLRAVGADVLGVCLIGVKADSPRYGYGYGYSSGNRRRGGSNRKPRNGRRGSNGSAGTITSGPEYAAATSGRARKEV